MGTSEPLDLEALGLAAARVLPKTGIPKTFVGFCQWINVTLTPGQRVLSMVAYDRVHPCSLSVEDRALCVKIFGELPDLIPKKAWGVIAAVCGGRGGKSYVLIALRLVYGALTRDLRSLAPGQKAVALIVAPNDKLRREVVAYALGAMRSHATLKDMIVLPKGKKEDEAVDSFGIRRADGHVITFEAGIAARGGYGGRGRSLTDAAFDEVAFFRDASFEVNDKSLFQAAAPRVLPGGQTILASTPWGESGLLYDFHQRNFGKPTDALTAHAPTLLLQDAEFTREIVAREYDRDPENADREFGAKFLTSGTSLFFEGPLIQAAIDETIDASP